ncbi:MAG: Lrp/AsnC family transcriptional regulator [Candidatus Altiarchaeota archaeon]|nr:Lrp/AsnC family transcriptional regulator [Candidatus Altiarchaeota archaeon]
MEELKAVIGIKCREGRLSEIGKQLKKSEEIVQAYEVTGEYDVIAVGSFKGTIGLEKFVKGVLKWKWIERTTTFVVLTTVKE